MTLAFDPDPRDALPCDGRARASAGDADLLLRIGNALAGELDLARLVQRLTDEATRAVGAELGAFFYDVTRESGESETLYAVSGAPRDAFAAPPMPRKIAFDGPRAVRLDDLRASADVAKRAPFAGVSSASSPVVSYLAVPVTARNQGHEVLGGLFFGHSEPGRFTERDERVATAIAAQSSIAFENARLFSRMRAQDEERASQARYATMAADVGRILTGGGPLDAALARCGALIAADEGVGVARIWVRDGDLLELGASVGPGAPLPIPTPRVRIGESVIGRIAASRAPIALDCLEGDSSSPPGVESLPAFAGLPLETDDALVGVLALRSRAPLSSALLESLRPVASLLALGIQRAEQQARLRRSEVKHRLVAEASNEGIWFWDVASDSVEWNDRLFEMLGLDRSEWGGDFMAWFERLHPEDQPRMKAALEAHLAQRAPYSVPRFRIRDARGEYRVCTTRGQAEWDAEGAPVHMAGTFADITEQVRAQEALAESEHRHRQILDSVRDMVFSKAPGSRIVYANKACRDHYGRNADSLEIDRLRGSAGDARVFERGEVVEDLEEPSVRHDGELRYFHVVKSPIFDQSGKVAELVGVARDITERKRDDDDRRFLVDASVVLASSIEYRETLANVARLAVPHVADWCAIDLLGEDGTFQRVAVAHVDPAKVELARELHRRYPIEPNAETGVPQVVRTGRTEVFAEITDELLRALVPDPELLAILRELGLRSGLIVPLTSHGKTLGAITLVSAESKRRYNERAIALAEDVARRAAVAVENARLFEATQRALDQRDRALDQLRQLNADLEQRVEQRTALLAEANRELESFSYTVSHDLRAPIRHISGFVDLLGAHAGDSLDDKSKRWLRTIGDASKKMGALIDALLAFSRMGRSALARERVDLGAMTRSVIEELAPDIAGRRVEFSIGPLPEVSGDSATLRVVLTNLVSNAVKYTRTREVAHIEIGAREDANEVEIWVRDDGVGFDMQYAPKLFGVFSRLHASEEFEGTGIGLATVRRIVQRHGGRTWAEGAPDRGATIFFTLPRPGSLSC